MKIRKYSIILLWLVLAFLSIWAYVNKVRGFIYQPMRYESLQNKPPFINQIRPPPILARENEKHLKLNIIHSNYEPIGPKPSA